MEGPPVFLADVSPEDGLDTSDPCAALSPMIDMAQDWVDAMTGRRPRETADERRQRKDVRNAMARGRTLLRRMEGEKPA